MAIPVVCSCGKAMRVPTNLAGRRVKCLGCGQPVRVPNAGPSGIIEDIDRVPGSKTPSSHDRPRSQTRRKTAEDTTSQRDGGDRPRSRRNDERTRDESRESGNARLLLWGGIVVGGLLAIVGSVVLIAMPFRGNGGVVGPIAAGGNADGGNADGGNADGGKGAGAKKVDDAPSLVALVPGDAEVVAFIRIGDLLKTLSGQQLRARSIGPQMGDTVFDDLRDMVVFSRSDKKPLAAAVTVKPIESAAADRTFPSKNKTSLNGKAFYVRDPGHGAGPSFLLYGPRTMIIGSEADIVDYLKQPPVAEGPMAPMLCAAGADESMFRIAFQGTILRTGGMIGTLPIFDGLPEVQSGRVTLTDGTKMIGTLAFDFADDAKAAEAKDGLAKVLDDFRTIMPGQIRREFVLGANVFAGLVEKSLAKAHPSQKGNVVTVPIEVDSSLGDLVERLDAAFPMLIPS